MKKIILVVIVIAGLGAAAYYWKGGGTAEASEPEIVEAKVERGPIRQIVTTTGKVVSNLDVDIKCKASGTVIELPFDVSDVVQEGDVLVALEPVDMDRVVRQAEVSLAASQARLATAKQNLLVAERNLKTDRERAQAALQSAEVAARDARAKADRVQQLYEKKLASPEERDTAETAAMQAMTNLANARIRLEELKTQEDGLEVSRQNVKLAETQVEMDQVALDIANDRKKDTIVRAPMNGVVTARTVQTGQIIASGVSNVGGGTSILTLSDLSRIFVLASVDESDIGKVQVGQLASITVDAYPSMQFVGKVVRIASKGLNTQNVVTFEVKIEVLGATRSLVTATRPEPPATGPALAREVRGGEPREGRGSEGRERRSGPGPASREGRSGREGRRGAQSRPGHAASVTLMADLEADKKGLLKPEMTANIDIVTAERGNVLQIPVDAVSRQAGQMYANVPGATPEEPGRKPIEVGITDGVTYELVAGLGEGDTVLIRRGEVDSRWAGGPPGGPRGGSMNTMRMMRMGRGR